MSRRVAKPEQSGGEHQFYATPAWAVCRLLEELRARRPDQIAWNGRWLEPCAGDGAIIRAVDVYLGETGNPGPTWSAVEIRPEARPFLDELSNDVHIADFLSWRRKVGEMFDPMVSHGYPFDVAITNPPFELALDVLDHARILAPVVILLLRVALLESDKRVARWRTSGAMPAEILILPNRPSFTPDGGTDSTVYAWMVWRAGYTGDARTRVLGATPKSERARRPAVAP